MNRIIKFRAWNEEDKCFETPDSMAEKEYNEGECVSNFWGHVYRYGWKLSQFTGVLDKNGKEIWEGDILDCKLTEHYHRMADIYSDLKDTKKIVEFKDGCFGCGKNLNYEYKVIGNVYENPKLLTEDK